MKHIALLCISALTLGGAAWLLGGAPAVGPELSPPAASASHPRVSEPMDLLPPGSVRAALASETKSADELEAAAAPEDDLLALLRAVTRAYADHDGAALGRAFEALLGDPSRPEQALRRLAAGGLERDPPAMHGAVLTLGAALVRYQHPLGPPLAGVKVDGRAFVEKVLEGLAAVLPPEQGDLSDQLIQAKDGERYLIDLSYLTKILELRRRFPEQAQLYSGLLVHMAENLQGEQGFREFYELFASESEDPVAVKVALCALLPLDPASFLPMAEELYTRTKDPRLKTAVAQAIASSAPLADATDALVRLADSKLFSEFGVLGRRPGAREKLEAKYSELVGAGGSPPARRLLVGALHGADEVTLVGIAQTDPDANVRLQALLTSTVDRKSSSALIDEFLAQHERHKSGAGGLSSEQSVLVAGNLMLNSNGPERQRTKDWLMSIATDGRESDMARKSAVRTLQAWVPRGTFAGWMIGGEPIE